MTLNINLKAKKPAKRYAQALINPNPDTNKVISDELEFFVDLLYKNEELKAFLFHPVINMEDKKEVLDKIMGDNFTIKRFLFLLLEENRLDILDEIKESFIEKIKDKEKILPLDIILAIEPDEEDKKNIIGRLENKFKSKIEANFITDKSILAGLKIKFKDTFIDLSLKKRIENFKNL